MTTKLTHSPNVRFYLDILRGKRPLRKLITRTSHENLNRAADVNPREIEAILRRLENLKLSGQLALDQITITKRAALTHNKDLLIELSQSTLSDIRGFKGMLGKKEEGARVLDFRKLGLRPDIEKPSFANLLKSLGASAQSLTRNELEGDIFLYRALLRANTELLRVIDMPLMAPLLKEVRQFLLRIEKKFPFGTVTNRAVIREGIGVALIFLSERAFDPAKAQEKLGSVIVRHREDLAGKLRGIPVADPSPRAGKVRSHPDKPGTLQYCRERYNMRTDGAYEIIEEMIEGPPDRMLGMIKHEIDSILAEMERNVLFLIEVNRISQGLPGSRRGLEDLFYAFALYKDPAKRMVCADLFEAAKLARIGPGRPVAEARKHIEAIKDFLAIRIERLETQEKIFNKLYDQTETSHAVQGKIIGFAHEVAGELMRGTRIDRERLTRRLGGMLQTYLDDAKRVRWLKQARSHVTGVLTKLNKTKQADLENAAINAARHILLIEFDYQNRKREFGPGERKVALANFYLTQSEKYGRRIIQRINEGNDPQGVLPLLS